jgi:hypothetical protein
MPVSGVMRPLASVTSEKEMVSVPGAGPAVQHARRPTWCEAVGTSGVGDAGTAELGEEAVGTIAVREGRMAESLGGTVVQPASIMRTMTARPTNRLMEGAR